MKIVKNILIKPVFVWTTFESIKRIDGWRRKPADIDVQRNYATVTPSVYTGAVGTSTVMFVYAAACGVSLVFIAACVPETKDRSLEQVDDAVATQQRRLLRLYVIHPPNGLKLTLDSDSMAWWLGSRVVSVLDSGAEGPGSNRSRDAVG